MIVRSCFALLLFVASCTLPAQCGAAHASGGGTYILSGIRTEFQFSESHVQCKIGNGVFPNGTVIQMYMESKTINAVTIDSSAKTVVISGTMVSEVRLRFTDGTFTTLRECQEITVSTSGQETVVPVAMKLVSPELEFGHLLVGNLQPRRITVGVELAFHCQA